MRLSGAAIHCKESGLTRLVHPRQLMELEKFQRDPRVVTPGLLDGWSEILVVAWNKGAAETLVWIALPVFYREVEGDVMGEETSRVTVNPTKDDLDWTWARVTIKVYLVAVRWQRSNICTLLMHLQPYFTYCLPPVQGDGRKLWQGCVKEFAYHLRFTRSLTLAFLQVQRKMPRVNLAQLSGSGWNLLDRHQKVDKGMS